MALNELFALEKKTSSGFYLNNLTGVRAFAVLWVLWMHTWALHGPSLNLPLPWTDQTLGLTRLVRMGEWGVDIFFVLSGFLLAMPFLRQPDRPITWATTRQFWLRRALRVLPAFYVALAALLYIMPLGLGRPPTAWQTLHHALFLNPWFDTEPLRGAFWSLPVEAYFYIALPGIVLLGRRTVGIPALCCVLVVACLTFRGAVFYNDVFVKKGLFLFSFAGRVDQFAIGILCAYLAVKRPIREARHGTWLLVAGLIALWVFILFIGRRGNMFANRDVVYVFHQTIVALIAAVIVYASCSTNQLAKALFGNALMMFVGTISYSIYIWHTIVLDIYVKSALNTHQALTTALFTWPLIFIISTCSYLYVERPFLQVRHGAGVPGQSTYLQRHPARFLAWSALALVALAAYNNWVQPLPKP